MKSPTTFKEFLVAYGAKCGYNADIPSNCEHNVDIALYSLLRQYETTITPIFEQDYERFHKMFRIIDIISPGVDNAIWYLMNEAELIWEVLT